MAETIEQSDSTRERLLRSAAEVFAEAGFRKSTVREIVSRAEANLNAVNYHFGDKKALYEAVFAHCHEHMTMDDDMRIAVNAALPAEQRLRAFVSVFLRRATESHCRPTLSRLMLMEMAEPTGVLDEVVDRFLKPRFALLVEIIGLIVGDNVPDERLRLCAESIVGQCVHLVHAKEITTRLMPFLNYSPQSIEQLINHVVQFSLAALNHLDDGEAT